MSANGFPPQTARDGGLDRTVLVVGGAGFIGSVLVRQLIAAGYGVRVLDRLQFGAEPIRRLFSLDGFELLEGDFREPSDVSAALDGVGAVIHLGAVVGDPACQVCERTTVQTNYAATALLVDHCRKAGVRKFLFASTCSVYGASDEIVDEHSALNPVSLYARTKIESERVLLDDAGPDFEPTILRLGTAFGWSHRPRFDLVVNLLTAKSHFEREIVIYNEEQWRPFVHVFDIARSFCAALGAPPEYVAGEVFNVGSDNMNHRLRAIGETLYRLNPNLEVVRESNSDRRNYRVSFAKIRRQLGFECVTTLDRGIAEIDNALKSDIVADYSEARYHNHKGDQQPADDRPWFRSLASLARQAESRAEARELLATA